MILRVVLGEHGRLREWLRIKTAFTSEITRVECLRVLDRLRIASAIPDRELARRRGTLLDLLRGIDAVRLNRTVLDRAAEPFPTLIRTLDAVHLSSALLAQTKTSPLRFATHDRELATAAVAVGLRVIGA